VVDLRRLRPSGDRAKKRKKGGKTKTKSSHNKLKRNNKNSRGSIQKDRKGSIKVS